ncbi:MAG: Rne/Rng family ribonuclease [Deltaproteobacteria bacterium]|nr:Rne/Rng family ribonuclease [Deltaproteobacteria bacterium]
MQNEILINAEAGETRVAILERGLFSELHIERRGGTSMVGSVLKGRVTRVLPGMQAAFVDIGLEKAAFLYAGDYIEQVDPADVDLDDDDEPRPRRTARGRGRQPPQIDRLLREGQEIVVQVAKEPIGTKGARITSHVSIAGRHLVLTPWGNRVGVSRRIDSDRERRRLREAVERVRPRDLGFIIRTAGEGAREADLEADVRYLASVWDEIQQKQDTVRAPTVLHSELSLPLRVIRDFANTETKRIVIDSPEVHATMQDFVERFLADPRPRIELYRGTDPIFDHFAVESQIDANLGRKVWLKSGGYLIVDQSEALTAIDVNTGRYVGKRDLEETVLKTNLEAVKEVVYQLRFRNIGGLIIIDLIDMESSENREKVYRALQEALRQDKAKTNILKISELGLVEMTRKRTRENLVQTLCEPCAYCEGRGYVLSGESVAFKILREIRKDLPRFRGRKVALAVHPRVAEQLLRERAALHALERELGREIEVRARPGMHQEQFEITALEPGPPVPLTLRWLGLGPPEPPLPLPVAEAVAEAADGDGVEKLEIEGEPVERTPFEIARAAPEPEQLSALDLLDDPSDPSAPETGEDPARG